MAQSAQMNFRIDAAVKSAGDAILRESDVSASALVRSTWEYLIRNRHAPDVVSKLLAFLEHDGEIFDEQVELNAETPVDVAASMVEQDIMGGPLLISQFYERIGIEPGEMKPRSFEDMKLDAYASKYTELA